MWEVCQDGGVVVRAADATADYGVALDGVGRGGGHGLVEGLGGDGV